MILGKFFFAGKQSHKITVLERWTKRWLGSSVDDGKRSRSCRLILLYFIYQKGSLYTVWFINCGILQSIISMLVFREVMDMVFISRNDNGSLYLKKGWSKIIKALCYQQHLCGFLLGIFWKPAASQRQCLSFIRRGSPVLNRNRSYENTEQ